jgi:serine phosphatase RsbU (regulator of sigma subunit)
LGFPPEYSAIAAPLRAGERRLGILCLIHSEPGRYGGESRAMTAAFASYAAVAIENTRLFQESQKQASISTVMLQVVSSTQLLTTLPDVLEAVVDLVPMLAGVDRCAILLWDQTTQAFLPAAAYGLEREQQVAFDQWYIELGDEPAFDELRSAKSPLFIYDVATDTRLSGATAWILGFETLLLMPLLAQGEVLGAMLIDYQEDWLTQGSADALHDERLAIIQGITLQTASAIENTQLREAQREEAYVSAALLQVAQAVASLNDLSDILNTIVRIIPLLVGVDRCIIFLWDDESSLFRLAQAYGLSTAEAARSRNTDPALQYAPGEFRLLDTVREANEVISYSPRTTTGSDARPVPPDFSSLIPGLEKETSSLLGVPLAVKGDVLGVLVLEEADDVRRSSYEKWLEIVTGIAHQTALALQSDRLQQELAGRERLERELQLAREIQQTLMPRESPQLTDWELAVLCSPARQVGGDFYDFFELDQDRLGLVIADVADKGMPAALFMALTRTLVRAAAQEEDSPSAALVRTNDLLVPDAEQGMFVTALYAVLSQETGKLTYANAGHNQPLLFRSSSGELEILAKGGMALGVLEGSRAEEHSVTLEPGDFLVFYTDGVTEAMNYDNQVYGEPRLEQTILSTRSETAQSILDTIEESVAAFAGSTPPSDDLTLMVLRRLG